MMKRSIRLLLLIGVLIFAMGVSLFIFHAQDQKPALVLPATVNRDCAPWDGSAFTVAVQYDATTVIYISIWKSPDIKFPSTFVLSVDEGQVGHAYILPELGPYTVLSGKVVLQSVSMDKPIEGRYSLRSEGGELLEGKFKAEWENKVIFCG